MQSSMSKRKSIEIGISDSMLARTRVEREAPEVVTSASELVAQHLRGLEEEASGSESAVGV